MPEVDVAPRAWRGIDELAELIGAYCWVENRIFELSGAWATGASASPGGGLPPALRVWCAGLSRRHGLLAARWAERLPVRAGVDRAALVAAPPGPWPGRSTRWPPHPTPGSAWRRWSRPCSPACRPSTSVHGQTATPVSEGSVLEVLAGAHRDLAAEISGGRALLEGSADGLTRDAALGRSGRTGVCRNHVFPAVHAS